MKTMNRRDFLKLTGASAVVLTLAACGSSGGDAPATSKEAQIENAINAYRREKGLKELKHEDVIAECAAMDISWFATRGTTSVDMASLSTEDYEKRNEVLTCAVKAGFSVAAVGNDAVIIGMSEDEAGNSKLTCAFPANDTELTAQLETYKTKIEEEGLRYIGVSTAKIDGKTYWLAYLVGKKTADAD